MLANQLSQAALDGSTRMVSVAAKLRSRSLFVGAAGKTELVRQQIRLTLQAQGFSKDDERIGLSWK